MIEMFLNTYASINAYPVLAISWTLIIGLILKVGPIVLEFLATNFKALFLATLNIDHVDLPDKSMLAIHKYISDQRESPFSVRIPGRLIFDNQKYKNTHEGLTVQESSFRIFLHKGWFYVLAVDLISDAGEIVESVPKPSYTLYSPFVHISYLNNISSIIGAEIYELVKHDARAQFWISSYEREPLKLGKNYQNVFINPSIIEDFQKRLAIFFNNKDFYRKLGTPHKLNVLLTGPPGNGKTSFVKAIIEENLSLFLFVIGPEQAGNFTEMYNTMRCAARNAAAMKKVAVFLIEDISAFVTMSGNQDQESQEDSPLTLSDFLNVLDGFETIDNTIFILTANHIDKFDPALLRSGRIDAIYHLENPTYQEIHRMVLFATGRQDIADHVAELLHTHYSMSTVQDLLISNVNDLDNLLSLTREQFPLPKVTRPRRRT